MSWVSCAPASGIRPTEGLCPGRDGVSRIADRVLTRERCGSAMGDDQKEFGVADARQFGGGPLIVLPWQRTAHPSRAEEPSQLGGRLARRSVTPRGGFSCVPVAVMWRMSLSRWPAFGTRDVTSAPTLSSHTFSAVWFDHSLTSNPGVPGHAGGFKGTHIDATTARPAAEVDLRGSRVLLHGSRCSTATSPRPSCGRDEPLPQSFLDPSMTRAPRPVGCSPRAARRRTP